MYMYIVYIQVEYLLVQSEAPSGFWVSSSKSLICGYAFYPSAEY